MTEAPKEITPKENRDIPEFWKQARAEVEREANQINHRVTWLIVSQGLLLAAYSGTEPLANFAQDVGIPIAGLLLCIGIWFSINAAYCAMEAIRKELADYHGVLAPGIFKARAPLWKGKMGSYGVCAVFGLLWLWILFAPYVVTGR